MPSIRPLIVALFLIALVTACSDDDPRGSSDLPCAELFADGVDTPDLDRQPTCRDGDEVVTVASDRWSCDDGRELFANGWGHGVKGEPWSAEGSLDGRSVPDTPLAEAIDACR